MLGFAQLNYNTSVYTSHKFTPHELVFGYPARFPSSEPLRKNEPLLTFDGYLESSVAKLQEIITIVLENLINLKMKSKVYCDHYVNLIELKIGDKVWLIKEPKPGGFEKNLNSPYEIIQVNENSNVTTNFNGHQKLFM